MKKFSLSTLLLLFFLLLGGTAAQRAPLEYESAWTTLEPGQPLTLAHPLGRAPQLLYVWVRLPGLPTDSGEDIETIRPWTELSGLISILEVSSSEVTLLNSDSQAWEIRFFVH